MTYFSDFRDKESGDIMRVEFDYSGGEVVILSGPVVNPNYMNLKDIKAANKSRETAKKPKKPRKKKSCCGQPPIVKWLGVRWHGTPWPKRWKEFGGWPTYFPERGCGCMVKPKAVWEAAKMVVRA